MSDTRRHVTPGWGPGHPRWPGHLDWDVRSAKHLARDRRRGLNWGSRHTRFTKHGRNTTYNFLQKIDQRDKREALAERP